MTPYRGRFAPSPTGSLHAGSLVAALASYLDARANGGSWRLRIDDIDPPRQLPDSVCQIQDALRCHGLEWHGEILFQSQHVAQYESALNKLWGQGYLFRCTCTRSSLAPNGECVRSCSQQIHKTTQPHSIRVRTEPSFDSGYEDLFLGWQEGESSKTLRNFIVKRRDGLYAYQLAAAIDDASPNFSHIIRGADLLKSTHRQRWLQLLLGLQTPLYGHIPIMCDRSGAKLSKQSGALPLNTQTARHNLHVALSHLRQPCPPPTLETLRDILNFATEHWSR